MGFNSGFKGLNSLLHLQYMSLCCCRFFFYPYGNSIQAQQKYKHQNWQQKSVLPVTQLKVFLNSLNFGTLNSTLSRPSQPPPLHTHTHTHTHRHTHTHTHTHTGIKKQLSYISVCYVIVTKN